MGRGRDEDSLVLPLPGLPQASSDYLPRDCTRLGYRHVSSVAAACRRRQAAADNHRFAKTLTGLVEALGPYSLTTDDPILATTTSTCKLRPGFPCEITASAHDAEGGARGSLVRRREDLTPADIPFGDRYGTGAIPSRAEIHSAAPPGHGLLKHFAPGRRHGRAHRR